MKRFISVIIILTMLLGTVGCRKSNVPDNKPSVTDVPDVEPTEVPVTVTEAPEVCITEAPDAVVTDTPVTDTPATEVTDEKLPEDNNTENLPGDNNTENLPEADPVQNQLEDDDSDRPTFIRVLTSEESFNGGVFDYDEHDFQSLASAMRIMLTPEDEALYPNLAKVLEDYSDEAIACAKASCEFLQETIDESLAENEKTDDPEERIYLPLPWYDYTQVQPVRSDSTVFSFLTCNSSYSGGVHGYYGVYGENYDTQTGERIRLADVVYPEKFDYLAEYMKLRLEIEYNESLWYDTYDVVQSIFNDKIKWVIDYDGLEFYWNPYEIGSYAAGIITIKILFDELPYIFTGKYINAPRNYMLPIDFTTYCSDIDNDGFADYIYVNPMLDGYDSFDGLRIVTSKLDSDNQAVYTEFKDEKAYGYKHDTYFVKAGDSKYIYFFLEQDSNDSALRIYKLGPDGVSQPAEQLCYWIKPETIYYGDGEYDYNFYDTLYSPDNMNLYSRNDVFGTTFEYAWYSVGKDGLPVPHMYLLNLDGYWTTVLKDMEFDGTDPVSAEISGRVKVPAGTKIKYFRTDGIGRVDFMTEDGTCFAMYLDELHRIDGESIWDLFDVINAAD